MVISIAYNRTSKGWVVTVVEEGERSTFHTTRSDAYANALGMARSAVKYNPVTIVYEGLDDLEIVEEKHEHVQSQKRRETISNMGAR